MSELSAKVNLDGQEPFLIDDSGGSQGVKFSQHVKMTSGDSENLAGAFCEATIEEISKVVASARRWRAIRDNWSRYAQMMLLDIEDNELAHYFFTCYQIQYRDLSQNQKSKVEKIVASTFDGLMSRFCIKLYGEGHVPLGHTGYVHGLGFYEGVRGALRKLSKSHRSVHLNATLWGDRPICDITHTFVHECTHKYAGTGDYFYIDRDATGNYRNRIPRRNQAHGLTFATYLTGVPVENRLNNADSTAWFCHGLMDAELSETSLYAGADGDVQWSSSLYRGGARQQTRIRAGRIN